MKKVIAITVLAGWSLFAVSCTSAGQADTGSKPSVHVQTRIVNLASVTDYFQVPGTIKARTQTVLSSKVMGQILSLKVREGDRVRSGDVLIEIEGRDIAAQLRRAQAGAEEAKQALEEVEGSIRAAQAALRTAEANRDLAQTTRKRYDTLRERHSISPQEFDEADARDKTAVSETERAREMLNSTQSRRLQTVARIEQAEAEVEAARAALGYLKIIAPISGIVTSRQADPGMQAAPGMPLLAIEDDGTYQLHSTIEESRAGSIRIGERASVQIDGVPQAIEGRIAEIVPASDPATRTYTVKLDLSIPRELRGRFHSGFFGRGLLPGASRQALLVPESAIVQRGQLTGVYIVQSDRALLRLVKTGKHYDNGVEILSGLGEGVRFVITPTAELTDGVVVTEMSGGTAP